MSEFLSGTWALLVGIYYVAVTNGVPGCIFLMIAGIVLSRIGLSITGQEESFSGTASYGNVVLRKNPAIQGSAKGWFGRLVGQILRLGGGLLFLIGLLALVNVLLYGV